MSHLTNISKRMESTLQMISKALRHTWLSFKYNSMIALTIAILGALIVANFAAAQETPVPIDRIDESGFVTRVITTGLNYPTALNMGADGYIWVAERAGKRITRVHPDTGQKHTVVTIDEVHVGPQHEGILGMALHPELLAGTGNDYFYVTYTYNATPDGDLDRKAKIVRYTYDEELGQASDPFELISGIPAWNDHNAGTMTIGPDGYLYYTNGEQGGNQGANYQRPILSQVLPTAEAIAEGDYDAYTGKVLRLALDGSIPEDNPEIQGVRSHIFTYGHRNQQGLAFGENGILYSSEHGPSTDDEINIITAGGNYGWPFIAGYADDMAYEYANWSEAPEDLRFSALNPPKEVPVYKETDFKADDLVDPIYTFFTVDNDYDFTANCGWICNPTIGPSAIAHYVAGENGVPELDNTLLIPALKHGTVYVLPLSEDGLSAAGDAKEIFNTQNRYRDILISEDTATFYLATDSGGTAAAKFGSRPTTNVMHNPGAIIAYTYVGHSDGASNQTRPAAHGSVDPQTEGATEAPAAEGDQLRRGEVLFANNCAACHSADGSGSVGPSLHSNDHLADDAYVVETVLFGGSFMTPFKDSLNDQQIADVATFIRNSWGNEFGPVDPATVQEQR